MTRYMAQHSEIAILATACDFCVRKSGFGTLNKLLSSLLSNLLINLIKRTLYGWIFIPVQFLAQGVVIIPVLRMKKGHRMGRAIDDDPVLMLQAGKILHVKIQADIAPGHDGDDDFATVRQDDGPVRQGMRGNWHHRNAG